MARHAQNIAVCTIGVDIGREDTRLVGSLHDHSACAIAKQHAGGAVVEIENAREDFRTDHQRTLGRAAFEHGISHRQSIDEAAAHGLHIKRRATVGNTQFVLHDAGGGRKHHIGRGRGHNDQIDLAGLQIGRLQGLARGFFGQIAAVHAGIGEMARLDAGALHNPFMRRFNACLCQLGGQVVVTDAPRGQIAACADDAGIGFDHMAQNPSKKYRLRLARVCLLKISADDCNGACARPPRLAAIPQPCSAACQ